MLRGNQQKRKEARAINEPTILIRTTATGRMAA
jgi:hypothetical protein